MTEDERAQVEVKQKIDELIENGSAYNMGTLDRIYHHDLKVVMIQQDGTVLVSNKAENMKAFQSKHDSGTDQLSRWAEFNYVDAQGDVGHVVVTRKMKLRNKSEKFILSIKLVHEDSRWQVIHETVFVQPIE